MEPRDALNLLSPLRELTAKDKNKIVEYIVSQQSKYSEQYNTIEELKSLIERLIKGGGIKREKIAVVRSKLSEILTPSNSGETKPKN